MIICIDYLNIYWNETRAHNHLAFSLYKCVQGSDVTIRGHTRQQQNKSSVYILKPE